MAKISYSPDNLQKTKDFLVCIDSDGCVFDTMEVKHKECFIPNIIKYWELEAVSKYARYVAEFINLYSKDRGVNRFPGLVKTIDMLADWDDVKKRGFKAPDISSLRKWTETETKLGNPALVKYLEANPGDEIMLRTLEWSKAVNESIEEIVRFVPPFPYVVECLKLFAEKADIIIVSGTPSDALGREWALHNIDGYVQVIAGQEAGSKKDCIATAAAKGYDTNKIVMLGDAPGDYKAAKANGVKFYPINPGAEDASWERLYNKAAGMFFEGGFTEEFQRQILDEFDAVLPTTPPWKKLCQ